MKPYRHARNSVRQWGGKPEDYLDIHNFMDISKTTHADMRHRAIFHNSLGPYVVERVFGIPFNKLDELSEKFDWTDEEKLAVMGLLNEAKTDRAPSMLNSEGVRVQVRDVAEQHVLEDLGRIPSVTDWVGNMTMQQWFGGPRQGERGRPPSQHIPWDDKDQDQ